ncbi:FMN-linked oxidoreductase [Sodiomyces alkalinus F11]|uniref:FMN-linked oxidoreductase n=1 Tax=Sodiomyces alkalinus (strain CBS 110278 / VKM F-3762 / F11) TaxID=1314773 RepID=A0A3N2PPS9_SODAK|nr:FMN-linked oxidoreductase [Sodiomyces alkalinus F11]ROT36454.1 FMN-linked oxidoreductase [Sodiomyces alkalinus F11]
MAAYLTKRISHPHHGIPVSRPETPALAKEEKCKHPIPNVAAQNVPFFTPAQDPPAGSAIQAADGTPIPRLFTPIQIRGVTLQNRIWVSPMCQYSAHEGFHTPWHITHYGGIVQRGPGFTMIEATAVQANGRITPEDSGIWLDAHVDTLRKHVEFAHSQNQRIGIQLAHAGRKASTVAPWLSAGATATEDVGGWPHDVVGPSDEPFGPHYPTPRSLTVAEIDKVKRDFVAAAHRALHAGFDVVELHFAHGYLVSSFLTPAVNKRTDRYGGSFENRTRLALEIVDAVRAVIPKTMPLFVRISATDWLETNSAYQGESWGLEDAVKLAVLFSRRGVDVLDVSSGGNHALQKVKGGPGYQVHLAKRIKKEVGDAMLVSTVGSIKEGKFAEEIISGGKSEDDVPLDLVAAGRMFQKNPGLVWYWADDLGVSIQLAHQIGWGFGGRGTKKVDHVKMSIP